MTLKATSLQIAGSLLFEKNSNLVTIVPPAALANTYTLTLPTGLPGSTSLLQVDTTGQLSYASPGGTGTVTSVALSLPAMFTVTGSPVTTSGTLTATLASQTANRFFMSPNGSAGAPTFRQLAYADVSNIVGTGANTLAAGNDSRFHTQNTDTGTTNSRFDIAVGGANEIRLTPATGSYLELRTSASALANLRVNNIEVEGIAGGTILTINKEEILLDDNIIVLNNNYTGSAPSENGGIEVERGTLTNAGLTWNETTDVWEAGLVGSTYPLVRRRELTFTSANVVSGSVDLTHGLLTNYPASVQVYNNLNEPILCNWSPQSTSITRIDISPYGAITGTWRAVITG